MKEYTVGNFEDGTAYLKIGNGPKNMVIFPETAELSCSFVKNPKPCVQKYSFLLPDGYTIYVIGYDPEMSEDETPFTIVEKAAPNIEKIGKSIIVGISYGGPNAITFAANYPHLTEKLLLIVSAYKLSDDSGQRFVHEAIDLAKQDKHYEISLLMNTLCNNRTLRIIQNIFSWKNRKKMAENDNPKSTLITGFTAAFINNTAKFKALLPKIKAPTYVFGGDRDIVFGEKEFQETADLIPNGNLILFRGQGHLLMVFKLKTFKKRLKEALSE